MHLNDIADRDLDAKVARTADRPLAAGTISVKQALAFLAAQCAVGGLVLVFLPPLAIAIALAALLLVAAYPFMKRITWWPQVWLGLTFNWGVLVGYAALGGTDWLAAGLLYAAAALWTLGYDTIYACQDMEDDALVGVKSSARALGNAIGPAVGAIYGTSLALTAAAAIKAGAGLIFAPVFAAYAVHLVWQASRFRPEDGAGCLAHFKIQSRGGADPADGPDAGGARADVIARWLAGQMCHPYFLGVTHKEPAMLTRRLALLSGISLAACGPANTGSAETVTAGTSANDD